MECPPGSGAPIVVPRVKGSDFLSSIGSGELNLDLVPLGTTADNLTAPARIYELHAMHYQRHKKLLKTQKEKEREEKQRLESERAALKMGTRAGLRASKLCAQEASDRLYNDHKAGEMRLALLQRKAEQEERQKVEETRIRTVPKRIASDTSIAANPGERMYQDHVRREMQRQAQEAKREMENEAAEQRAGKGYVCVPGYNPHEKLYEDAARRRELLDRKLKEKEAEEERMMAELALVPRTGHADKSHLDGLYSDHETKLKNRAKRLEKEIESERQEYEEAMKARRNNKVGPQEPIWERGRSAYFVGVEQAAGTENKTKPTANTRKAAAEPTSRVDVAMNAVLQAVAHRCADDNIPSLSEVKELVPPLRAAVKLYAEAQSSLEKTEGYPALCVRASQRLFRDCYLLPEFEGFQQCREPNAVHQVQEDFDGLMRTAAKAQVLLQELFLPGQGAKWEAGSSRTGLAAVRQAISAYNPGMKDVRAAQLKATVKFQAAEGEHRYRHLLDIARLTLIFPSCDMLHAGLDEILAHSKAAHKGPQKKFEVVQVNNRFGTPSRLGERYVEVLIVLMVESDDGDVVPHVCELRLEEHSFHQARMRAVSHLQQFEERFRSIFYRPSRHMDALAYVARLTLSDLPESHNLRIFRRHLAQSFGSVVSAWRRLGCGRQISFERFREMCHTLNCGEFSPVHWCALDPGCAGCISLFEMDPEAVSILARVRLRILAMSIAGVPHEQAIFERLVPSAKVKNGRVEAREVEKNLRSIGVNQVEAQRLTKYLDFQGGLQKPPGTINAADVGWLVRLPLIVDLDAVMLCPEGAPNTFEALRQVTISTSNSRRARIGAASPMKKNSRFDLTATRVPSPRSSFGQSAEGRRSQSARRSSPRVFPGATSSRSEARDEELDEQRRPSLSEEIAAVQEDARRASLGLQDGPRSPRQSTRQAVASPTQTRRSIMDPGESPALLMQTWHNTLRQSGSFQPQNPRERTSLSLPPSEKPRSSLRSQQEASVHMSSRDVTASPKAKARASIIEATPSPKEGRQSLQQPRPVVGDEGDHVEAAPRQRNHVVFETDGLGIVDPIQKSPLAVEELTPTSTADVDTPSKLEASDGFHDDNDDEDCSHEEIGVKEAHGGVEQRDVVADQIDVPAQADGDDDDDYNDDYNADAQDENGEVKQAEIDDYLEQCF